MTFRVKNLFTIAAVAAMVLSVPSAGSCANAQEIRLLVLGDSLSAGLGLPPQQAFPARLEAALAARGHEVKVINAGVSGDTSRDGRARLDWVLSDAPQAAIVELGANDGLRGLDVQAMRDNLAAILDRLEDQGVKVLLAGMKAPPNYGKAYVREYERAFSGLADEYDVIFYPFFLDGVATVDALNQSDHLHPNAAGVEVIVRNILPAVERLLQRVRG